MLMSVRAVKGAIVAAAAVGAAGVASLGCSFLISFDDQPSCDGGLCTDDATVPGDDAPAPPPDATAPREGGPPPPPRDAGADAYNPCKGLSGAYCATDRPTAAGPYAGPPSDLLICSNDVLAHADSCDGGCLSMPNPFPDTCSGCPGKPDGVYCGRDFPNFPHDMDGAAGDDDFLVACQGGNYTTVYPCPHGCKSNGTSSSCYP
jgi:hypothetical protein